LNGLLLYLYLYSAHAMAKSVYRRFQLGWNARTISSCGMPTLTRREAIPSAVPSRSIHILSSRSRTWKDHREDATGAIPTHVEQLVLIVDLVTNWKYLDVSGSRMQLCLFLHHIPQYLPILS
jgi:hypothetical protein